MELYVVCSTEESKDVSHLSIDELQSSLICHEPKVNWPNIMGEETAYTECFFDRKTDLLSARRLQDKGYCITILNGECEVYDSEKGVHCCCQNECKHNFSFED